jgi:hypothetical protein
MKTLIFAALVTLSASAQETPAHAPDGATFQRIQSIDIPPIANAPFSATVTTEWTRILPDGNTITTSNHRTVARDSSGRVFQERRYFSPTGNTQVTQLSELDYQDPNRHQLYICHPATQLCNLYHWDAPAAAAISKPGPLPGGKGTVTLEDLGRKTIENLNVVGSREITTFNANTIGNNQAEPVVKEFWYAPSLGINVVTKRFDPRASAAQNFDVTAISLTEPDPKFFVPPTNYRILRMDPQ